MKCRGCYSKDLEQILDLGKQRVSDFREDTKPTNAYPLKALICKECMLVQLDGTTPPGEMYHENYGFKSGVSDSIKDDLKDIVRHAQEYIKPKSWLDIASNDGTLLSNVSAEYKVGVDPITFLCKEAEQHADRIVNEFFKAEYFTYYPDSAPMQYDQFDVITSISCFYDMDDPNQFVSDVKKVLAEDGVWVIQQNYLLTTLELGAVDNFCHEHLTYFTLLSLEPILERHGLEVFDLSTSMVNGGSLRTLVAHKGKYPVQDSVERQRTVELDAGLHSLKPYLDFAEQADRNLKELRELIDKLISEGNKIAILAASTRGATIWQAIGLGPQQVSYAVERNPKKVGRHFSAIGIPIMSEEYAHKDKPDAVILGPWFFSREIIKREQEYLENGGVLILPLPSVQTITAENMEDYL